MSKFINSLMPLELGILKLVSLSVFDTGFNPIHLLDNAFSYDVVFRIPCTGDRSIKSQDTSFQILPQLFGPSLTIVGPLYLAICLVFLKEILHFTAAIYIIRGDLSNFTNQDAPVHLGSLRCS